ncbi:amidohydrolase [Lewinella sp. 4G2]|uniref:amidohydrolase n=1 Tax=Lewinella sp. 4G2 TaxID=1803372 RepID=UPI0007B4CF2A|nr:amidohydrolase [Lewinella sp. 4G2]OAV43713.1 amidohydrolase [Lewinella sp. 4G2]
MNMLRVTTVQADIQWEAPAANLSRYQALLNKLTSATDLIVLPEMFTTGFTMAPAAHAETMDGPSAQWMLELAREKDAAVTGSLIIREGDTYYNRLLFVHPDGRVETYDKRHGFTLAGEDKVYAAGGERVVFNYRGWRIRPTICYDLRFPAWMRNTSEFPYDLLLCVASWPNKRARDWSVLLQARAIENQAYVVGVNRVGTDPNGHEYSGDSCVIDPGPAGVVYAVNGQEEAHTEVLSLEQLHGYRERLPFLRDGDAFTLG